MAAGRRDPPGSEQVTDTQDAILLHPILDLFVRVIAAMSLLVAGTAAVLGPVRTLVAASANAALNLFLLLRLRRGHSSGVAFLSALGLLLVSLHAIARGSGIHDVGMVVVAVLMMVSALLERRWQALVVVASAGAGVWLVGTAEVKGWFPFDDDVPPDWDDVVVVTILLVAAAVLMRAVVGRFRTGLVELQRSQERRLCLEEDLRQVQRLRVLGELASGVAHDFNNQLTGVFAGTELLRRELRGNRALLRYVDDIKAAADRSADLTRQLLATARRAEPRRQRIDLARITDDVIALLRRTLPGNIEVIAERGSGSFVTTGDPSLLHSALLNLGVNARDAMPRGGTVTFHLERRSLPPAEARSLELEPGPHLELTVTDTGTGMDGDTLDRIFDPFFTTKEGGTGLGLAAAYGTARAHGGSLTATSVPARGSCFRLLLPAPDTVQGEAAAPPGPVAAHI